MFYKMYVHNLKKLDQNKYLHKLNILIIQVFIFLQHNDIIQS